MIKKNTRIGTISNRSVVYGAGRAGVSLIYVLKKQGINVSSCFDNDEKKIGMKIWGDVEVVHPYFAGNDITITICSSHETILNEISEECRKLGYTNIIAITRDELQPYIDSLSDRDYLEVTYMERLGKYLNLDNPKRFNEKLQWLKLYDRKPEYTVLVDKFEVKKKVAKQIGEQYVIPTYGVYESYDEIQFGELPDQFVLKCTHDSGSAFICHDKTKINFDDLKRQFQIHLNTNYYLLGREWPYKSVKPRIIAEKYLLEKEAKTESSASNIDNQGEIIDYKFLCFNGEVKCSFVCTERKAKDGLKVTFFDREWNRMPFIRHYPSSEKAIKPPRNYSLMIDLAEKLSKDIPFVRVDFYENAGKVYFGEYTFFPGCGFEEFTPDEWDEKLGEWILI